MKTLKDLVLYQQMTGEDDLTIIKTWFFVNDMECEGISMITELAESKIKKLQFILDGAKTWLPYLPDLEKCNRHITHDQAQYLHRIITMYLLGMELTGDCYEWAKAEIPNIVLPTVFYVPCKEWLEQKYGIKFKEQRNDR